MFPFEQLLPSSAFKFESFVVNEKTLILHLVSIQDFSCCPLCSTPSSRVHSTYSRSPSDLPCFGFRVQYHLQVRRFFCDNISCSRAIFTERIEAALSPYARFTKRCNEALTSIALSYGGQGGARLALLLGFFVSGTTLIQKIRNISYHELQAPKVLGVDDWAFRKGHQYGTILVDLQEHKIIDLLKDRESESLEKWLQDNSGVEIITRDRAKAYASGAKAGAPKAIQVADRFHLMKNLGEAVESIFKRQQKILQEATKSVLEKQILSSEEQFSNKNSPSVPLQKATENLTLETEKTLYIEKPLSALEEKKEKNRKFRLERYNEVKKLKKEGLECAQISREVGLSVRTAERYIREEFPEWKRPNRKRMGDQFKSYLWQRFNEGCQNATELFNEVKGKGFSGSIRTIQRYIEDWKNPKSSRKRTFTTPNSVETKVRPVSPKEAVWLLIEKKKGLSEEEIQIKEKLFEIAPEIKKVGKLAKEFQEMLREKTVEKLSSWMDSAKKVCKELKSFVAGLKQDEEAVKAGISERWSNGQVEGQVNRLKLVKRQMFGRAKLDLLRLRLTHKV